jgi:hypothetical protein
MDCPVCNNNISINHLMINSLSCPTCSTGTIVLASHIHNVYSWVCYVIKHNNIVKYVGYTTDLVQRLKKHVSSEVIYSILNKRIYYKESSLSSNNITIAISLILSERSLANIFKPQYNLCYNNTDINYRIFKKDKLVEYNSIQDKSILNSLMLSNKQPEKKDSPFKITKTYSITSVGDVMAYSFIKVDKYNNLRSYCYRWSGECKCKIPCKYNTEIIILKASLDKSIVVDKELEEFKKKKVAERDMILNIISPSAATIAKSLDSYNMITKQYMKQYLDYIAANESVIITKTKLSLPKTNEELRNYAKLSFELTPYITRSSKLSDITYKNYTTYINAIIEKYNANSKNKFNNPDTFVKYPIDIINLIKTNYKHTTAVSLVSAIIWRLRKAVEDKEDGVEPIDIYVYTLLQKEAHETRDEIEKETAGKLTEKEEKNFIDWETVIETRSKMEESVDLTKYSDFMDFVILCLYTYNPPTRADYANMKVFIFDEDIPVDYTDNYCVIDTPKPRFVFWKYKTATGKEPVVIDIPDELVEIIFKWLEVNPSVYLLASKTGDKYTPMTENALCMRVRSIFKRWTGKAASINTLRHAFVSYNSRNDQIIKEKEENARKMMHSSSMADKYRRYIY